MGDLRLNSHYFKTNRGIIKILQIIIGIIVCKRYLLDVTVGFVAELNFVALIINVIFLLLNFTSLNKAEAERIYTVVGTVLFLIAVVLNLWAAVTNTVPIGSIMSSAIFMGMLFLLFLWDVKILQGEAAN